MVRGIAKEAGQAEPTAEEKDPAFLAMQLRSIQGTLGQLIKVQQENWGSISKAFGMTDAHLQVIQRVTRDLTLAVATARRLQVEGDVTLATNDLGQLKLRDDLSLDMGAYYEEYRAVAVAAGQTSADLAVILWSQGHSLEEAVARASLERIKQAEQSTAPVDPDYEEEFFRGNNVEDHHEQVQEGAQANG